MPSPQAAGTLKRPPFIQNGSSSSNLSSLEQQVLSFQTFIKRTPPLDHEKPLPPPPSFARRASSSSPPQSRASSFYGTRRSSSVYSRTMSQWGSNDMIWKSTDFVDDPLPPLPMLQPVAYSVSTPQLVKRLPTPPPLEPRTYSPLIIMPPPTVSRATTPSPPSAHKPSILLPTPPASVQVPKNHLHTVSLEKAKETVHSPGAVHLLPEELRAQTPVRSKSHEPPRIASVDLIAGKTPLKLIKPPTLVDSQGRQRAIPFPSESFPSAVGYPFPPASPSARLAESSFAFERSTERQMALLASQSRKASKDKVIQALGLDDVDESRGRTRQRGPRNMEYAHYLPSRRESSGNSSNNEETDAQMIAKEYHTLLTEQYRAQSHSSRFHDTESDDGVKAHMKMVPKPLFTTKPPAKLPGTVSGRNVSSSSSSNSSPGPNPFASDTRRRKSNVSKELSPFRLSTSPDSICGRRSTSGSIPISPPTDASPVSFARSSEIPFDQPRTPPRSQHRGGDPRVSAFYPHVASRKGKNSNRKSSKATSQAPPRLLLAADIIAERDGFNRNRPDLSPVRSYRSSSLSRIDSSENFSQNGSNRVNSPLLERVAKGAVKYADLLTRPTEPSERQRLQQTATVKVDPGSPHLLPSPSKSFSKPIHLGWTDVAKNAFEESRSLIQSPKKLRASQETPSSPQVTHTVLPARPLDERSVGLKDLDSPRRKNSVFTGMLESWKENKAEKRREELKKIIRVVPEVNRPSGNVKRRSSTFGWM